MQPVDGTVPVLSSPRIGKPYRLESDFGHARILVVDDEPANARFLERLLAKRGYTAGQMKIAVWQGSYTGPCDFPAHSSGECRPRMTPRTAAIP